MSDPKSPDYIAYAVDETKDDKGFWHKIGAAWKHSDGEGIDLRLVATPVDGRVVLRKPKEEPSIELGQE